MTLPDIESLKRLSQSIAMLDAIISQEWESRYFSFNSKWSGGEMMASMRTGTGDEYFILFKKDGAILKGFDHESEINLKSADSNKSVVFKNVPSEFATFLTEPAFSIQDTTFLMWRRSTDPDWTVISKSDDCQLEFQSLLFILDGKPSTYKEFAEDYYREEIALKTVKQIYNHQPLTDKMIHSLNPKISLVDLAEDIEEIAYPALSTR